MNIYSILSQMYQWLMRYYLYNIIGILIFLVFVIGWYRRYQTHKQSKKWTSSANYIPYLAQDQQTEEQYLIHQIQQEYTQLKKNILNPWAPINEDMEKFLVVYKQKDKEIYYKARTIEEKNRTIYLLQNQIQTLQQKLVYQEQQQHNQQQQEDLIRQQKETITQLRQRIVELENKFKNVVLLHKSITEKEQLHQKIIEEKNAYIIALQNKLHTIEEQFTTYKENNIDERFVHLQKQIESSKDKQWIIIVLAIVCIGLSIYGYRYIQKQSTIQQPINDTIQVSKTYAI